MCAPSFRRAIHTLLATTQVEMRNPPQKAATRAAPTPDSVLAMQSELSLKQAVKLRDAGRIEDALRACGDILRRDPAHPGTLYLMGTLAHQVGAMEIAVDSLQQAAASAPRTPEIFVALGNALAAAKQHGAALRAFKRAAVLKPASVSAHRGMAQVLLDLGRVPDALRSFRRALALRPDDLQSAYFVEALKSLTVPERSGGYVSALFDSYAEQFDEHLNRLGYRLPELIRDKLGPRRFDNALDLGCGTGLVGSALRGQVKAIDGVDVSGQMIGKAGERGVYRTLAAGDAVTLLRSDVRFAGPYELVTAADVFIYVGRLEDIFGAVRERLTPQGLFIFSVEAREAGDVVIQGSGRFAHSARYVERLAANYGFAIDDQTPVALREEFGSTIPGALYTLRRE